MAWSTFTGKGSKGEFAFPVVTVHQSGTLSLSEQAYVALGKPQAIDLLYDEDVPSKFGVRANPDGDYQPRRAQNGKSWFISGSSFFRFLGRVPVETQRYGPVTVMDGVLEVNLDDPMAKPKRRSRRNTVEVEEQETLE
ncbi:MAG: hypothetical protein OXH07_12310 [Chloroflexi bacterium]|nr:hypothetical protein [Chloroflexota bacterium]